MHIYSYDYYRRYCTVRNVTSREKVSARKLFFFISVARKASLMRTRIFMQTQAMCWWFLRKSVQGTLWWNSVFIIRAASLVGLQSVPQWEQKAAEIFLLALSSCNSLRKIAGQYFALSRCSLRVLRIQYSLDMKMKSISFPFVFERCISIAYIHLDLFEN